MRIFCSPDNCAADYVTVFQTRSTATIGCQVLSPKQFPGCQFVDQRQIGFQEVVLREFLGRNPLNVAKNAILDFSLILAHDEEAEFNLSPIWIFVLNPSDFVPDGGQDSEFFFQFSTQRGTGLFSLFNLSPRELPL